MKDTLLLSAVRQLSQLDASIPCTMAKVKEVRDDGFYVKVSVALPNEGAEEYDYIPTLRSKYFTYPVRVGDFVILTTLSHLQAKYFNTGEFDSQPAPYQSYVAIPFNLRSEFRNYSDDEGNAIVPPKDDEEPPGDGNIDIPTTPPQYPEKPEAEGESDALPFTADGFHFRTPELGIQGYATDKELHVLGKEADYTIEMNNAVQIFEGKNEVWTKGNAKITIDGLLEESIKGTYDLKVESEYTGLYMGEVSVKYQAGATFDVEGDLNIYSGQKIVIRSTLPISIGTYQNTIGKLIAQGFSLISGSQTGPIVTPQGTGTGPTMANGVELANIANQLLAICD
ncbi:hypothetical protein FBF91_05975 [Campylobacter upsaliensis]|uniref:hypothetical protein n=1 Tax=Campylobacter upsaliensis TaxID=28080 RepID=UPI0012BE704B|nr:hypothetical protein [Campylobacter upsaliensis]EAK7296558.1 hypothetical protein [Campylobacter upsaliensis]MBJ6809605.1 hypothetical protein [Campylobacter upsaliensis]